MIRNNQNTFRTNRHLLLLLHIKWPLEDVGTNYWAQVQARQIVSWRVRSMLTLKLTSSQMTWKWQLPNPVSVCCFNPAPGSTPATRHQGRVWGWIQELSGPTSLVSVCEVTVNIWLIAEKQLQAIKELLWWHWRTVQVNLAIITIISTSFSYWT